VKSHSGNEVKPARLLSEKLLDIVDADAMAGVDLQTSPLAWQQRRELLGHVAALEEDAATERQLTLELSTLLEPVSGGADNLGEIVARIRAAQALHAEVQAAMLQRQRDNQPAPTGRSVPECSVCGEPGCPDHGM
jgi:hypothetical protein